jgi:hypothetical protein
VCVCVCVCQLGGMVGIKHHMMRLEVGWLFKSRVFKPRAQPQTRRCGLMPRKNNMPFVKKPSGSIDCYRRSFVKGRDAEKRESTSMCKGVMQRRERTSL